MFGVTRVYGLGVGVYDGGLRGLGAIARMLAGRVAFGLKSHRKRFHLFKKSGNAIHCTNAALLLRRLCSKLYCQKVSDRNFLTIRSHRI